MMKLIIYIFVFLFAVSCQTKEPKSLVYFPENILYYSANPRDAYDRTPLAFSDQGAWFAYGFPTEARSFGGFSGPFIMTQENGVWCSKVLAQLQILDEKTGQIIDWNSFVASQKSFNSHLEQIFENEKLKIEQTLFFLSPHSALIQTRLTNKTDENFEFQAIWKGKSNLHSLHFLEIENGISIQSDLSPAQGFVQFWNMNMTEQKVNDSSFVFAIEKQDLKAKMSSDFIITQSFIFPEYNWEEENKNLAVQVNKFEELLQDRIAEKKAQLQQVYEKLDSNFRTELHKNLAAKCLLTLQNNWRIPAGELKHSGLFPSYHYQWFHGFWAWDSWKHAAALAEYDPNLAEEQIRAMYDYMDQEGFIVDCIYRDTTLEKHNYRDTKPPLSAWAVWKVFQQNKAQKFLEAIYPKIVKQHQWWYLNRDHDQDGLCEYGSTDGTLIAAKWESGMDNAVRFDESQLLQNSETAWSLNQESVDLNAYLFAEKNYLAQMARQLGFLEEANVYNNQAEKLKTQIQNQFFDTESGWFYDTSLDGNSFIKVMGCEGWIPLWAEVATVSQAEALKTNMMNPDYFNSYLPLQTLSASEPYYFPDHGYWRGPVWIDQSYFGIIGLKKYGFQQEALELSKKLIHHAKGLLEKGPSIRENYHPISGEGMEAENFSWSAAHFLMLMLEN